MGGQSSMRRLNSLCCAEVCDESSGFYQFSLLFGIEEISRYEIYEAKINIIRQE